MNDHKPNCKKIPINKLIVTPMGIASPLCQTCIHQNCGNPISPVEISIFGITKTWRLFCGPGNAQAVIECDGYTPKTDQN